MFNRSAFFAATLTFAMVAPLTAQQDHWVTTWAASPSRFVTNAPTISVKALVTPPAEQTIRNIVHVSLGGDKVRVRFSNALSTDPLVIPASSIALRIKDDAIDPASSRALTFNGGRSITVPPGADVLSDPIALRLPAGSDLAVSLFTRGRKDTGTLHPLALQTSYAAVGDQTASTTLTAPERILSWPFLSEVEVVAGPEAASVIAFGDSITDGGASKLDTNLRWPDDLAARLAAAHLPIGVGNAGIAGNRLLHDGEGAFGPAFGPSGLSRFDRDVTALAGVRYLIVLIGINDIAQPGSLGGPSTASEVTAEQLEAGMQQLVARAHLHGIRVMGATILPFAAAKIPGYVKDDKETKRTAVNLWIRTSGVFDAVVDLDGTTRDPEHPLQLRKEYDGGDGLHPGPAGLKAMADAIPLEFFRK